MFHGVSINYLISRYVYIFLILNIKCLREATKKKSKKFHNKCELSPKMENPPSPYFTTILADFGTWKSMFFLQLLRVCEWGGLAKSLSKISLKSSSKQTDYEKFSSLWTKIWYCSGEVLPGQIFEFCIRSEIRHGQIRIFY